MKILRPTNFFKRRKINEFRKKLFNLQFHMFAFDYLGIRTTMFIKEAIPKFSNESRLGKLQNAISR